MTDDRTRTTWFITGTSSGFGRILTERLLARGDRVAATLGQRFGYDVPVLGRIPLDTSLREGGDVGKPIVESDPTAPAALELTSIASRLSGRGRGLAGMQLGLTPSNKF